MKLIDPTLLERPDVKAAFPPTARERILRPIIDFINALSSSGNAHETALNEILTEIAKHMNDLDERLTNVESALKLTPAPPINDLPNSPVSISATNLANIGLLASNEADDRKAINVIFALLRTHGWIKS